MLSFFLNDTATPEIYTLPRHDALPISREVVVARRVEARQLGRLAPDKRRARLPAALRDALDHLRGDLDRERAAGEIVEEEQGFRPLHDEVVDAHRHEVDADRAVLPALDRDLQLGADAIGGGDEDRICEARRLHVEQRAEAAEAPHRAAPRGRG